MKGCTKLLLGTVALMVVPWVTGCNTMRGVAKDIKKGGEAVEKATE